MTGVLRPAPAAWLVSLLLASSACAPAMPGTPREQLAQVRGRDVQAVLHSGERVVLRSPVVEGDSVFGGWTPEPGGNVREAVAQGQGEMRNETDLAGEEAREWLCGLPEGQAATDTK
jgi:hypothetical protein